MMSNLFSIFDPSTEKFSLPLNWLSLLINIMLIPPLFWMIPSRLNFLFKTINNLIHKEFKILTKSFKGLTLMMTSLFLMIMLNNVMGLFPYIFTATSHLAMSMSMALPIWISLMLFGWLKNSKMMFSHLVPMGTPTMLMSFMVLIETISNLIRPWTLSIRLTANMIAGHLLICLLSSSANKLSSMMIMMVLLTQMILLTLEFAVAIIQAYVFSILSSLYSSEVN